jgi:hypothetical protein
MNDNRARNGTLGAILGALIAIAFAIFLLNGGEHVGKKTVNSDADLPNSQIRSRQPRCATFRSTWPLWRVARGSSLS